MLILWILFSYGSQSRFSIGSQDLSNVNTVLTDSLSPLITAASDVSDPRLSPGSLLWMGSVRPVLVLLIRALR